MIDSSGLKTCVHSDDAKVISEKSRGFELYSRDNCEINMVQQVRPWSFEIYCTHSCSQAAIEQVGCALMMLPNPDNLTECSPIQTLGIFEQLSQQVGQANIFALDSPHLSRWPLAQVCYCL